jgi:energy-coupling factor transport system substrate-specific component
VSGWIRGLAAAAAFVVVAVIGILVLDFGESGAITSWAYLTLAALGVAFVVYAAVEYAQTRRLDSIAHQFDTRTIVLIPIAVALNIILGQAVAAALKIPIYLDSIGTILVGALAGPIPGALTGLLANTLWTFVVPPPFHSDFAAPFAVVAVVIGLLAGAFGRFEWLRPRPTESTSRLAVGALIAVGVIVVLAWLAYLGWGAIGENIILTPTGDTLMVILGFLALAIVIGTIVGLAGLLFIKRDLTVAYVVVAGVITGIIAAVISAPIAANLFGGVTGAGTDFLVAAFRQAGADIQAATLGQGLISDPIDKIITFTAVYVILGAMAVRTKARFPQGERMINVEPEAT